MRTNSEFSAGNKVFALYLGLFLLGLVGLWFAVHPKSPLRSYKEYYVLFQEIGTLHEGDPVQLLGMKRGYVAGVTLRKDGVIAHLRIESKIKVPKDSRFRVVNAGLLGQREVEIRVGESHDIYESGAYLSGGYDQGSTRLVYMGRTLLSTVDSMLTSSIVTWDSTLGNPEVRARMGKLSSQGKATVHKLGNDMVSWRDSLVLMRKQVHQALGQLDQAKQDLGPGLDSTVTGVQDINSNLGTLAGQAQKLTTQMDWLTKQLQGSDNTAGLLLSSQAFHDQMETALQDVRNLLKGIQQNGLNMNIDWGHEYAGKKK